MTEKLSNLKEIILLLNDDLISKEEFLILKEEIFENSKNKIDAETRKKFKRKTSRKYLVVKFDDGVTLENSKNSKETYLKSIKKMVSKLDDLLELDLKINHYPIVVDTEEFNKMPSYLRDSSREITINNKPYRIQVFGSIMDFKSNLLKIKNQLEKKGKIKHKFNIELIKK